MGWVYQITNLINNKKYIGKTNEVNPITRWHEHLRDYQKETLIKRPLYDAMNKYGIENFDFSILEETSEPEEREQYFIQFYRTYIGFSDCQGYNATLGGDGQTTLDYETIKNFYLTHRDWKIYEIANYFEIDRNSIPKILNKYNISIEPTDQEVIDYYLNNDVTQKETADYFYMSPVYVNRVLKRNNIKSKRPDPQAVIDLYLSDPNITQAQVAEHFGINSNSVSRILIKNGISKPRPAPKNHRRK